MPTAAALSATIGSLFKKKKTNEPISALLNTYKRGYKLNLQPLFKNTTIGKLQMRFKNATIGLLEKKKKFYFAGPIATFSKCDNRAFPKNAAKNPYKHRT